MVRSFQPPMQHLALTEATHLIESAIVAALKHTALENRIMPDWMDYSASQNRSAGGNACGNQQLFAVSAQVGRTALVSPTLHDAYRAVIVQGTNKWGFR